MANQASAKYISDELLECQILSFPIDSGLNMIVAFIDQQTEVLSAALGLADDKIKLILCLLFSYPFGFIFKRIHSATIRHAIGIVLGFFYQYLLFREQCLHALGLAMFTYLTVKFCGRNRAFWVFVINMTYLSGYHIFRIIVDYRGWKMDMSIVLMTFVCKCTSFAWAYQDGGIEVNKLSKEHAKKRIETLPSLFEYLSFMYFYAVALVGPAYDYVDHVTFITRKGDYEKAPRTFLPSFVYLLSGLAMMFLVVVLGPAYDYDFLMTDEYAAKSWFGKYLFLTISMQVHRFRYFTAWLLSTANVTVPGLNYNPAGKTVFDKFGRIVSVRPIDHEISDNPKDKLETWNTATQLWLKNQIFTRVVSEEELKKNPARATYASNVTFMVSAFWHGFYPNYYITFFLGFMLQQISKSLFRMRENLRWIPEPIGYILRWGLTGFYMNFAAACFSLLDFHDGLKFFKAWNFIPNVVLGVVFLILNFTSIGKKSSSRKPRTGEAKPAVSQPAQKIE